MAKKDDKLALGLGKLLGTPAKKPAVEVATSTVADTSTVENEPAKEDIIDSVQTRNYEKHSARDSWKDVVSQRRGVHTIAGRKAMVLYA